MRVFIDPGHTGILPGLDPGAVGHGGTAEADVVLKVANYLREFLFLNGIESMLSRETDDGSVDELWTRVKMAENYGADILVSIHCNAFSDPEANGYEVWTWPGCDTELANFVLDSIKYSFPNLTNRGRKEAKFGVLRGEMPSVLVELAFITNPSEESLLNSEAGQKKFAEAIASGIKSWIG